jgi:hypothetical protein
MSDAEAAAAIGVSESSVERAKATLRQAHPSVVGMLERGEISVTTVLEAVRAELAGAEGMGLRLQEQYRLAQAPEGRWLGRAWCWVLFS